MGTMALVGVIMIALFYVQVRVIFSTPVASVDHDPIEFGSEFFGNISTEFSDASDDVSQTFTQIGGLLEDESKRVEAEQAIYAELGEKLQIKPEDALASEGIVADEAPVEGESELVDEPGAVEAAEAVEVIEEVSSPFPTAADVVVEDVTEVEE